MLYGGSDIGDLMNGHGVMPGRKGQCQSADHVQVHATYGGQTVRKREWEEEAGG